MQRLDLDAFALRQVDEERRAHRAWDGAHVRVHPVDDIRRNVDAFRACQALDFAARVEKLRPNVRIGPERPDRQPRRPGESGERDEEDELLPDRHSTVASGLRLDVRIRKRVVDRSDAGRRSRQGSEDLPKNDAAVRASLLEVLRLEYVTTARAKGLSDWVVTLKHALKNALIPTVTVLGLQVGFLIGGAIVVETLFAMPGIGSFGVDAIIKRDYPQVQAFVLVGALVFVLANLSVDLLYSVIDPRIQYGKEGT